MREIVRKLRYIFDRGDKFRLLGLMFMIVIGSFLELLGVGVFMPFINVIMDPSKIEESAFLSAVNSFFGFQSIYSFLTVLAAAIALIYVVKNVYLCFMQNNMLKFSYKTRMKIAVRLLSTYMREPYTFHLRKNISEMQRCLENDTMQFMLFVNASLQEIAEFAVCLTLGLYLFDTSHSITVTIVVLLGICIGFFALVSKKVSTRLGKRNQYYRAKLFQWINQGLGGIKEVKVLGREDYFINSYRKNYKELIYGAKTNELLAAVPKYIVETVAIVGMLAAVVVKMYFGRREIQDFVPQLTVFAVAAFRLLPSVGKINAYTTNMMYSVPSVDLIYHDLREIDREPGRAAETAYRHPEWKFHDRVELQNITYTYPDAEKPVLESVSMTLHYGETVAFIGSSGAGKTTLADIILGLLPPDAGRVLADGYDVTSCMGDWHRQLGYIPQTIYLSDDTIRNNVAFGIQEEQIDEQAVWRALEKAQLGDFVRTLEEGVQTFVGDRGVRLSGGQRQRIGIARALYHDPEILVLDEATSALDNETETAVMESIESLKGQKTMLIIAHRLTTIRNADMIYEVGHGGIARKAKEEIF